MVYSPAGEIEGGDKYMKEQLQPEPFDMERAVNSQIGQEAVHAEAVMQRAYDRMHRGNQQGQPTALQPKAEADIYLGQKR